MRIEHIIPRDLMRKRPVRVLVIGAGGTGSAIVLGLPYTRPSHAGVGP